MTKRLCLYLWVLIAVALQGGCAARAASPAQGARALAHPTSTDLPDSYASAEPPAGCPVTRAPEPAFAPPAPYPPQPPERYQDQFWYGTPELWTLLHTDATWRALPESKSGYAQKIFWWSREFDTGADPYPAFRLTIERLDVESEPMVVAERATNASADFGTAMLTGVDIPSYGCWKIRGHYRDAGLSFVVRVAP